MGYIIHTGEMWRIEGVAPVEGVLMSEGGYGRVLSATRHAGVTCKLTCYRCTGRICRRDLDGLGVILLIVR